MARFCMPRAYPNPARFSSYDTSLTAQEAGPTRLLELIRSHWGIENGLHYRRDETLREDWCHLKQEARPTRDGSDQQSHCRLGVAVGIPEPSSRPQKF